MSLDASINSLENVDSEQHWINLIWRKVTRTQQKSSSIHKQKFEFSIFQKFSKKFQKKFFFKNDKILK